MTAPRRSKTAPPRETAAVRVSGGPFDPARAVDYPAVVGCDEVGRGALCGPVVVAAVFFDPREIAPALLASLDDSKKLTAPRRVAAAAAIRASARWALAASAAVRIDALGVRAATLDAMRRAVLRLRLDAPVLVDGRDAPPGLVATAVVRGDALVPQIAAASILAKVTRDALMARLARRRPAYGWETNVGYGAARHLAALRDHGATPHHRHSFAPVSGATST